MTRALAAFILLLATPALAGDPRDPACTAAINAERDAFAEYVNNPTTGNLKALEAAGKASTAACQSPILPR